MGGHRWKNGAPKFIMLSSVNRFECIFAKMVKYENEGKGAHSGGVLFRWGYKFGGAAIALNTEWKILISHRNVLRGIL